MMAAILNSAKLDSDTAILNSDTLLSSLRFTQKHSHSTLTLTQTNSIWLKVIHSHLTWWWQPSCILPSWFLPSWIQPFCSKLWLQLIQSDSKSFILTQLDDGGHLGFSHFPQKTSLNHSESTWWWNPSWICPCWIQTLPSWIQTPCYLLSDSLKMALLNTPLWFWLKLIQSDSNSFILTQIDDGSHLVFCHLGFSHFAQNSKLQLHSSHSDSTWWWKPSWIWLHVGFRHCHLGFKHLVIFSQIHSKTLFLHSDSDSN